MKTVYAFLTGVIMTLVVFVPTGIREKKYQRVIELQDSLIHKAKNELEHTGDYSFCDGDEPVLIEELTKSL